LVFTVSGELAGWAIFYLLPRWVKVLMFKNMKKSRNYSITRNQIEVAPGTGVPIIPRLWFRSHGNSQHREDDTRFSRISHKA
jgi:hypothetical protein